MTRNISKYGWFGVASLLFLLTMCITITEVIQPSTAIVGQTINVTVKVDITPEESATRYFVFAVLVPKAWNIKSSATATFNSPYDGGTGFPANGKMRIAGSNFSAYPVDQAKGVDGNFSGKTWSAQITEIVGIGGNYGQMEWVAFISEQSVQVKSGVKFSGTINLNLPVGDGHTKAQLGYFVGNEKYGLKVENPPRSDGKGQHHYNYVFTNFMTITGTSATATDLSGPEPVSTVTFSPEKYSWNDLITIRFDASAGKGGNPTALSGSGQVYLCANANFTGGSKQVCQIGQSTKMRNIGNNKWEITIWSRSLFDIPGNAAISDVTFNFKNSDGTIVVKHPNSGKDFQIIPNCN